MDKNIRKEVSSENEKFIYFLEQFCNPFLNKAIKHNENNKIIVNKKDIIFLEKWCNNNKLNFCEECVWIWRELIYNPTCNKGYYDLSQSCTFADINTTYDRPLSDVNLDSIFAYYFDLLDKCRLKREKTILPIKINKFISVFINLTNNVTNIERHDYTWQPLMNKKDLFKLKQWYNKNKIFIPKDCFIKWWNYYINIDSTLEDLELAEDCVMK